MAKRKREGQKIPWPREKEKDRQYHGQEKRINRQTMTYITFIINTTLNTKG
jgi:hypothetical protein